MALAVEKDFFVVAREAGSYRSDLPSWASKKENPFNLSQQTNPVIRREVHGVPGAFQLLNVFSDDEVTSLVEAMEKLGFQEDAAVSLPRDVRHNDNLVWISDDTTERTIWQRCGHLIDDREDLYQGKKALGINQRFRFYRYNEGDFFKPHIDGAWPGSRVVNDTLLADAFGDRWSQMTFLILLSQDFLGGATEFYVSKSQPGQPARSMEDSKTIKVRTPAGSVLCFPHGMHPMHCLHGSETINKGVKYIIRTDVLFEL